jgi:hypothetical protein
LDEKHAVSPSFFATAGDKNPRNTRGFQGFSPNEDDGTRTRNHRIDSPSEDSFAVSTTLSRASDYITGDGTDAASLSPVCPSNLRFSPPAAINRHEACAPGGSPGDVQELWERLCSLHDDQRAALRRLVEAEAWPSSND